MNWEAIGAIGEVGGAIGVVATLAYLAMQVRQNSDNLRHNSEAVPGVLSGRQVSPAVKSSSFGWGARS